MSKVDSFDKLHLAIEKMFLENKELRQYICQKDSEVMIYHYDEPKRLSDDFVINIEVSDEF